MSVDTYARKTNLKFYEHVRYQGAELLVAKNLVTQAAGVTLVTGPLPTSLVPPDCPPRSNLTFQCFDQGLLLRDLFLLVLDHLGHRLRDSGLRSLVARFGDVRKCFLMCLEGAGHLGLN